jgi:hypothetical protein
VRAKSWLRVGLASISRGGANAVATARSAVKPPPLAARAGRWSGAWTRSPYAYLEKYTIAERTLLSKTIATVVEYRGRTVMWCGMALGATYPTERADRERQPGIAHPSALRKLTSWRVADFVSETGLCTARTGSLLSTQPRRERAGTTRRQRPPPATRRGSVGQIQGKSESRETPLRWGSRVVFPTTTKKRMFWWFIVGSDR